MASRGREGAKGLLLLLSIAVACSGSGKVAPPTPVCPGEPIPGYPCNPVGLTCPFAGCTGCICDDTGKWTCPTEGHPSAQCCTQGTFAMPCDPGTGNACDGVCQPALTLPGYPMVCVPAADFTFQWLGLVGSEGVDCSPQGHPGTDCGHSCTAGVCTATSAAAGAVCQPADDPVGTACDGLCDGAGACMAAQQCVPSYGGCSSVSCTPLATPALRGCRDYSAPAGLPCSAPYACEVAAGCDGHGACSTMLVPHCGEPGGDE